MIEDADLIFLKEPEVPQIDDTAFDPWRFANSDKGKAIIAEAIKNVTLYEEYRGLRKRKRKKHDEQTFELTIEAILCDLMNHRLCQRDNAIYVTRSNRVLGRRSRYRPRVYGKTFPDILDKLAKPELSWIDQEIGDDDWSAPAKRTTIQPGSRLIERMLDAGITLQDIGYSNGADPVVLKREKEDHWDEGGVVEYQDTEDTRRYRAEMREINEWLRNVDLDYAGNLLSTAPSPNTDERSLRRNFTQGSFNKGGRLFGGFWQGMSKTDRFENLFIDSESIAELDYGQMGPRQLYGLKGVVPTSEDLYDIPGFEDQRSSIKVIFSAMVFSDKPLSKMPKGMRKGFAEQVRISDVTGAIERQHPAIADLFYRGIGHELQFRESEIMVDILLRLKLMEIIALPIHDAVLVAASCAADAKQVMLDVFFEHVGIHGSVDISTPSQSNLAGTSGPKLPLPMRTMGSILPTSHSGVTSLLPLPNYNIASGTSMEDS